MNAVIENNKTAHDLLERLYPHFLGAMQELFDGSEEFDEANITQVIISKAARYIVEEGYGLCLDILGLPAYPTPRISKCDQ